MQMNQHGLKQVERCQKTGGRFFKKTLCLLATTKISRNMKPIKISAAVLLLAFASCSDLTDLNIDPNQPSEAESRQFFTSAQFNFSNNIWDDWNNGRMGLYYAQYWSSTYYSDESRYQIRETVNQTMWSTFYADVLRELEQSKKIELEERVLGYENRVAIVEVMKTMTFHYLSDIYGGPIPFSEAINDDIITPKYDSGEEVYTGLLANLDQQINILDGDGPGFLSGDAIFGGDVTRWKKFANSLRLRIALRMIDVKPMEAKAAIEKSLAAGSGGVMSSNDDSAMFRFLSGAPNNNPLNEAYKTRIDFAVSSTLVDYLKKYEDPRLQVYANPTTSGSYIGEIYGLEQGNPLQSNGSVSRVSLPSDFAIGATAPAVWLDYAEVEFMLAEIAARNIGVQTGATAEEHYANGIKASFDYAGLSATQADNYILGVPYVSASWKDVIGSQKWIAMYMQGIQGWMERLRLDFKDPYTGEEIFLEPADGSTDQDVEMIPYRMSYPVTEAQLNVANYGMAIQKIGGQNSKGLYKQWWDIH